MCEAALFVNVGTRLVSAHKIFRRVQCMRRLRIYLVGRKLGLRAILLSQVHAVQALEYQQQHVQDNFCY